MTGSGGSHASGVAGGSAVRSGELFAALSLATDLGTGQSAEHELAVAARREPGTLRIAVSLKPSIV